MAQDMTSTEAAQTVSTSARTPIEKEILKIEKKLREVEKLTQRIEAGEALDALQSQKLTKEDELRTALEGFKEQRQLEIEAAAAQEISRKDPSPAEDAASGMGKDDESNERPAPGLTMQGTPARKMFDARCFEGDWLDNFDQRLIVRCGHSRRSRTGGMITYSYMATVRKIGMPDTYLTIQFDADKKDWRCGNGVVDREASSWDDLHWTSTTGRMTRWTRAPPDVAIFFDAPPGGYEQQYLPAEYGGVLSEVDGATYFDGAAWQGEEAWMQGSWSASSDVCLVPMDAQNGSWAPMHDQAYAVHLVGEEDPNIGTQVADPGLAVSIPEPSCEMHVSANRLDWTIPDTWGKLRALPTQSHVASPVFDVPGSPGMQLEFYPNGKKSTEVGFCTLQLVRGPESKVGIKFELCLSGRSNGPKACLGRRFLADYEKPFDESDSVESQQVVVSFLILSTF